MFLFKEVGSSGNLLAYEKKDKTEGNQNSGKRGKGSEELFSSNWNSGSYWRQ